MLQAPSIRQIIMPRNFSFLPRTALFYPEVEDTPVEDEDPGDAKNAEKDDVDDDDKGSGDDGKGEKKKLVTLERHKAETDKLKAKIKAYEDAAAERKKSELSEADRLKAEKAELETKISRYEATEKKLDAFAKAKAALAKEGKVVDPEKEDTLQRSIRKLDFDAETIDDDVAELVQMASMPKGSGYKSKAGKSSKEDDDRDPREYSAQELKEIYKESPERYAAVMEKRKQLASADKAKKGKK